jgi:DNA-binding MarR family transcriptional regulator
VTDPLGYARVMLLANQLRQHMHEVFTGEPWMVDAGFRPPCVGVLRVIADQGPVSQRQISDALGLDPSDLVGAVDVLEEAGLVERGRDPEDRRRHAVVVTAKGRKAADRVGELLHEAECRALAHLDPDERRQLVALIAKALDGAPVTADSPAAG